MKSIKKQIKSSAFVLALLLVIISCEENAIEPLKGIYEAPEEYSLTNLFAQIIRKQDNGTRIFTIKIASDGIDATYNETTSSYSFSGNGNYISIDFIGKKYFLEEGTYVIATNESAKAGNYIAGCDSENPDNMGTCFFSLNNEVKSVQKVVSGNISVDISDSTNYKISGTLTLSDQSLIRITYKGTIIYEPDPEPEKPMVLSKVFATTVQPQNGGYQLITLKISTEDVVSTYDSATYSYSFTGNGNYVSIDFLSNSELLDTGLYSPEDNDVAIVGNFIKGYDIELWGIQFYNWGTCWFTIVDGVETGKHISDGSVKVLKNGSTYIITFTGTTKNGENIFAEYKGKIKAFGGDDGLSESYSYTNTTGEVTSYDFVTGETTVYEGVTLNTIAVFDTESNQVATFEAITNSEATSLTGTYTITEFPTLEGQMNNGWNIPDISLSGGTYIIEEGVKWFVKSGEISITEAENGSLTISGTNLEQEDDSANTRTASILFENVQE